MRLVHSIKYQSKLQRYVQDAEGEDVKEAFEQEYKDMYKMRL